MKRQKNIFAAILFAASLLLAGIGAYVYWLFTPVSTISKPTSFVVAKGASFNAVAAQHEEKQFIRSQYAFRFIVMQQNLKNALQAGSFTISPSQTPQQIAIALTKGTNDVWVTLLEGWRSEEMAEAFSQVLGSSFDKAQFIRLAKPQEGFLFPDTYLIPQLMTPEAAVNLLRKTFDKRVDETVRAKIADKGLSLNDAMILASIIEREARVPKDMQIVAGILENRLAAGIPLQVDCTLQYIRGYDAKEKTWWPVPLSEDTKRKSPYNTYLNKGLPPAPIANPSMDAVNAVINPVSSDYLYYISDTKGGMHYAKTLEEHNQNVQTYLR